jgi:DNA-directed RNA polymerase II subunit RPB7
MIGHDLEYNGQATPPQWADKAGDQILEKGAQVRLKIKGIRTEMGKLYAIGTMKEVLFASTPFCQTFR